MERGIGRFFARTGIQGFDLSDEPINILVRMPNWLGDCVMSLPAVRHLRETAPQARLYLAGKPFLRGLLTAQPGVAGFVETPPSGLKPLAKSLFVSRNSLVGPELIRGIDLGLLFTNSISSAIWLWRTGAERRIGFNTDCRRMFLTDPIACGRLERSWHFIRYYSWLAMAAENILRHTTKTSFRVLDTLDDFFTPALTVGDYGRREAEGLLRGAGVSGKYAVFAPASAYGPVKDWPPAHYRSLAERLRRELSLSIVLTGSSAQSGTCASIAEGVEASANLAGRTSLEGFAGLIAGSSLFVGGDSGGAHVAAALGVPTVAIFGITNPSRTRPMGTRVAIIGKGSDSGVNLDSPAAQKRARKALDSIVPDEVYETARQLIEKREGVSR